MTTRDRDTTMVADDRADLAAMMFDAVAAMNRARAPADVESAIRPCLRALGFQHIVLTVFRGWRVELLAGEPSAWWSHFQRAGYARDDILCEVARAGGAPFFWSEVIARAGLTPLQRRINRERRAFGLIEGLTSSIHHRDGTMSTASLVAVNAVERTSDVRAAGYILSSSYGSTIQALAARASTPGPASPPLTGRQLDCLRWVRAGKSATDIGDILGISVHTVRKHVTEACGRLGVRTQVQAVAKAISQHLLDS